MFRSRGTHPFPDPGFVLRGKRKIVEQRSESPQRSRATTPAPRRVGDRAKSRLDTMSRLTPDPSKLKGGDHRKALISADALKPWDTEHSEETKRGIAAFIEAVHNRPERSHIVAIKQKERVTPDPVSDSVEHGKVLDTTLRDATLTPLAVSPLSPLLRMPEVIDPADHILVSIHENEVKISLIGSDGIANGKSFLPLLRRVDASTCAKTILDVRTAVDSQFVTMYLAAPPGPDFFKRIGGGLDPKIKKELEIHLSHPESARVLLSALTNSFRDQISLLPDAMGFDVKIIAGSEPAEVIKALETQLVETAHRLNARGLGMPESRISGIRLLLKEYLQTRLCHGELPVSATAELATVAAVALPRTVHVSDSAIRAVLGGSTFHVETDETAHVSVAGNAIVVVDAGNPTTPAVIRGLKTHDPSLSHLHIYLTHCHFEHVAALAETLRQAQACGISERILYVPESAQFQILGFASAHPEFLDSSFDIRIIPDSGIVPHEGSYRMHMLTPPAELTHFIPSRAFLALSAAHPERARLFTGDINPKAGKPEIVGPEAVHALGDFLRTVATQLIHDGVNQLELFMDYGHFNPMTQTLNLELINTMRHEFEGKLSIVPYYDHQKDETGYRAKIE